MKLSFAVYAGRIIGGLMGHFSVALVRTIGFCVGLCIMDKFILKKADK